MPKMTTSVDINLVIYITDIVKILSIQDSLNWQKSEILNILKRYAV